MIVEIFFWKSKVELLQFWKRQRNLCFICCRTLWCLVPAVAAPAAVAAAAGDHKTISGTTDEMQSNGHVWFMTILELLFFGLHSMAGQLNGWMSSIASASGYVCLCVCVVSCVTCLFVLVRACVHFMAYLQAQLTASVFLLPYCRLLTFGLRSRSSSRGSNARPTLRLLNLAAQRDLRTYEQGANRIRKLPSALGIFFPPSVSILIPLLCCSCTLPDLLALWGPRRLIQCHVHTPLFH